MKITFKYTPELLQKAHEAHYKKFYPLRGKIILLMGFLAIWAGLLLLLINNTQHLFLFSIPLLLYGVIAIGLHFYLNKTIGRRAYNKLKDYHDTFTMEINDDGIEVTIKNQQYPVAWEKFRKALLHPDFILLYPNDAVFFIFPKVNFHENEFEIFEELVLEKIEKVV